MKKSAPIAAMILAALLGWFSCLPAAVPAAEKIVRMTVSGCSA